MGKDLGEIIKEVFLEYREEIAMRAGEGSVAIQEENEGYNDYGNWRFVIYADRIPSDKEYPRVRSELGYMKPVVSYFSLAEVPGCHIGITSKSVWIIQRYTKKGLGTLLNKMRTDACKQAEYGFMMAFVDSDNKAEEAILTKNGWVRLSLFKTIYPEHKMGLWTKRLTK